MKIVLETVEGFRKTVDVEESQLHYGGIVLLPRLFPDAWQQTTRDGEAICFSSKFLRSAKTWRGLPIFREDTTPYSAQIGP